MDLPTQRLERAMNVGADNDTSDPIAELRLDGERRSARVGRAFVADTLRRMGWGASVDAAALLLSELVANVVLHAGTDFKIGVRRSGRCLRIEVRDWSCVLPQRRLYADDATTGRGLRLVDALAADWGVTSHGDGKTVWFELAAEPDGDVDRAREAWSLHPRRIVDTDLPVDVDTLAAELGGWEDGDAAGAGRPVAHVLLTLS